MILILSSGCGLYRKLHAYTANNPLMRRCTRRGQLAGLLILFGELAGGDFAGLDVGLIEGIDAQDRTRDGRANPGQ